MNSPNELPSVLTTEVVPGTISPSEALSIGEGYLCAQQELDSLLREAYVALAGARIELRSSSSLLTTSQFPERSLSAVHVEGNRVQYDDGDVILRRWLGGSKPPRGVVQAQELFRSVLVLVLKSNAKAMLLKDAY